MDSVVEKTEQAAAGAQVKTESAMANVGAAIKDAAQKGEASRKSIATKIEEKLDDLTITAAVNAGLAKGPDLSVRKINVDTKNGMLLLKGTAPTVSPPRSEASRSPKRSKVWPSWTTS